MKKTLTTILVLSTLLVYGQLPVGTTRNSVVTDASGNVINTPITYSNQVSMVVTATTPLHIVNFGQFTNTVTSITNIYPLAISKGGNGVATTQLPGSWTNSINFTTSGTNGANAFSIQGQLGFTGVVTNNGSGSTNITSYLLGIVTNNIRTP